MRRNSESYLSKFESKRCTASKCSNRGFKTNERTIIKIFNQDVLLTLLIMDNNNKTTPLNVRNQNINKKTIETLLTNRSYFFETIYSYSEIKYKLNCLLLFLRGTEVSLSRVKLRKMYHNKLSVQNMEPILQILLNNHSMNQIKFSNSREMFKQNEISSV